MTELPNSYLDELTQVAEIKFRLRTGNIYEPAIRETRKLVSQYSNEGIASTGTFLRKTADAVEEPFQSIEGFVTEIYIDKFRGVAFPENVQHWLRRAIGECVDREVARAQGVMQQLCSCFVGATPGRYQAYVTNLHGLGENIKKRLDDAVTLLVLENQGPLPSNEGPQSRGTTTNAGAHVPSTFVSYSWDSKAHKQWVLDLADRLQSEGGIQVTLDRWDLAPGRDRTIFMERSINDSEFAVLICTPEYAERADQRSGGVGYEASVITGQLTENIDQGKFIPVLRKGDWKSSLPIWIKAKAGVDLRGEPYSEDEYRNLVRALHRQSIARPSVGPAPDFSKGRHSSLGTNPEGAPPDYEATTEIRGKWNLLKVEGLIRDRLIKQESVLKDAFYESQGLPMDHEIVGEYYLRYREGESMLVVTASIERGVDCHACAPRLSLFEFRRSEIGWVLVDSALAVTRWGEWGRVAVTDVKVFVIGDDLHALFLDGCGGGQGFVSCVTSVQARVGDRYQEILNLKTSADDSGSTWPGAEKWTSMIRIQPGTSGFYDLIVQRNGIRRGERFAESERFKFNGQKYVSSGLFG